MIDYKTITRKKKSAANIVTSRSTLQVITNTMFIMYIIQKPYNQLLSPNNIKKTKQKQIKKRKI